jgi:hypothetical protein
MLGKKLTRNLKNYFDGLSSITVPVVTFDNNTEQELPSIAVGYSSEETSFPGCHGHYTVKGFATVLVQGYEDPDNDTADALGASVVDSLEDSAALFTALNKPLSGTDSRPLSGFCLNGLFIRGVARETEGTSTMVQVEFDAFCAAKD